MTTNVSSYPYYKIQMQNANSDDLTVGEISLTNEKEENKTADVFLKELHRCIQSNMIINLPEGNTLEGVADRVCSGYESSLNKQGKLVKIWQNLLNFIFYPLYSNGICLTNTQKVKYYAKAIKTIGAKQEALLNTDPEFKLKKRMIEILPPNSPVRKKISGYSVEQCLQVTKYKVKGRKQEMKILRALCCLKCGNPAKAKEVLLRVDVSKTDTQASAAEAIFCETISACIKAKIPCSDLIAKLSLSFAHLSEKELDGIASKCKSEEEYLILIKMIDDSPLGKDKKETFYDAVARELIKKSIFSREAKLLEFLLEKISGNQALDVAKKWAGGLSPPPRLLLIAACKFCLFADKEKISHLTLEDSIFFRGLGRYELGSDFVENIFEQFEISSTDMSNIERLVRFRAACPENCEGAQSFVKKIAGCLDQGQLNPQELQYLLNSYLDQEDFESAAAAVILAPDSFHLAMQVFDACMKAEKYLLASQCLSEIVNTRLDEEFRMAATKASAELIEASMAEDFSLASRFFNEKKYKLIIREPEIQQAACSLFERALELKEFESASKILNFAFKNTSEEVEKIERLILNCQQDGGEEAKEAIHLVSRSLPKENRRTLIDEFIEQKDYQSAVDLMYDVVLDHLNIIPDIINACMQAGQYDVAFQCIQHFATPLFSYKHYGSFSSRRHHSELEEKLFDEVMQILMKIETLVESNAKLKKHVAEAIDEAKNF